MYRVSEGSSPIPEAQVSPVGGSALPARGSLLDKPAARRRARRGPCLARRVSCKQGLRWPRAGLGCGKAHGLKSPSEGPNRAFGGLRARGNTWAYPRTLRALWARLAVLRVLLGWLARQWPGTGAWMGHGWGFSGFWRVLCARVWLGKGRALQALYGLLLGTG